MTIRRRVFLGMVFTSVLTVLAGWAAIRYLSMEGFARIDQERAAGDAARVVGALDNELAHMDAALRFKSVSDITFRFAADRDPKLAANFFSWEALKGGGLNLMALYDAAGKLVAGGAYDLGNREAIALGTLLEGVPGEVMSQGTQSRNQGRGLLRTPLGPMLVCWQPVLNSLGWGPPRGTLLAGRFLDEALVARIKDQLKLDFAVSPMKEADPDTARRAREALREGGLAVFGAPVNGVLPVYAAYPDYLGIPAFLVRVDHPRMDAWQFRQSVYLALAFMGLAGALAFAASLALVRRAVLVPLGRITGHISGVRDLSGLGTLHEAHRDDEIGQLAKAFNSMSADLAALYDRLTRQHKLLRAIIDNIPHPIAVKDGQGRYLVANRAQAFLLGRAAGEVPGRTDSELGADEAWAEASRAEDEQVLASGSPRYVQAEIAPGPGGAERYFETLRLPLEGRDGGQVLSVRLDVTGRLLSERELSRSERKFRSLFESMTEGVCLHEVIPAESGRMIDYRVLDVNPAFERILGITRDEAIGRLASDLFGGKTAPFLEIYAEVAASGQPTTFESYYEPFDKHFHVSAFCPAPGQFATVFMETTEEIRTRQALERARVDIQHILDSMPSPVIGLDGGGLVAHVNSAASALAGVPLLAAQGLSFAQAFPLLAGQEEAVRASMASGQPALIPRLRMSISGEPRLVDLQVFPMDPEPGGAGAVLRLDDVTERARMEEVVLQTEKMMSVGGLAAGMAHEINNPLGGILQSAQVLKRRLDPETPATAQAARDAGCEPAALGRILEARSVPELLEGIRQSAQRAARIVANMLEFSRKSDTRMQPAALSVLMDKAVELCLEDYDLKKRYDFRKIAVERDYDQALPQVPCLATLIEQVLVNLIRNAAHAFAAQGMDGSARITLRTRLEAGYARMEVEDNGPGMDEATRRRIFEPFFSTKPPGEGTGLGLSVSFFIITSNHGGTIHVESEPGKGTRFVIKLPLGERE